MFFFTSVTANYIAKAKVLCKSLKMHNSNVVFILVIADDIPKDISPSGDLFDHIVHIDHLKKIKNLDVFKFKYNLTELCTAIKPFAAGYILEEFGCESITYLDPDIKVFDSLVKLDEIHQTHSMIFTPHHTVWESDHSFIKSNEILFLKRGTMNLGFFSVKNDKEGLRFIKWWSNRLLDYCFDDSDELYNLLKEEDLLGMYTDQKWIDLVPSYFDKYYILKDPGYNTCTWNLTNRIVTKENERYFVNGKPLRFFHFSGYDSGGHINELKRNLLINPSNGPVIKISEEYSKDLTKNGQSDYEKYQYAYAIYDNGVKIRNFERRILLVHRDIQEAFGNPFKTDDSDCYYDWIRRWHRELFPRNERRFVDNPVIRKVIDIILPLNSKRQKLIKRLYNISRGKK